MTTSVATRSIPIDALFLEYCFVHDAAFAMEIKERCLEENAAAFIDYFDTPSYSGLVFWEVLPFVGSKVKPMSRPYFAKLKADPVTSCVYFMFSDGLVKIGTTINLGSRVSQIRCQCGRKIDQVLFIDNAGINEEARLHEMFAAHATFGEWFTDCQEISSYAESNGTPFTNSYALMGAN